MKQFLIDYELQNGLTQEDYADFGKYVSVYISIVEQYSGHFNWEDQQFKHFCAENRIQQKGTKAKKVQENHFWFDADKPKDAVPKDVAHNFLRHIRNAFSHGNVNVYRSKHNSKYYYLRDFNTGNSQTMSGKIRSDLLWRMIEILLSTRT